MLNCELEKHPVMNENTFQVSDSQLINALRAGEDWAWRMIFSQYKSSIIRFVIFHHGSRQEADAVFREALMIFYEKINRPSFVLNAKIETYLFPIARSLWIKILKSRGLKLVSTYVYEKPLDFYDKENFEINKSARVSQIAEAIENLDGGGRDLLLDWYFHQISPDKITKKFGFDNEEAVLARKNQYISNIKKMVGSGL